MPRCPATPCGAIPSHGRTPPPLDGAVDADVCVVGLGGSGLAAVGAALEAGARVVGIDAGPIAGGAAGRNGGFLLAGGARFHHDAVAAWGEERAVGIYEESLAELDRLTAELGPEIVRRVGSLRIPASPEEAEDCADQLAVLQRHGLPARAADGPTGAGVFIPGDGSVQPLERCRLLARRALAAGARLYCDTAATAPGRRPRRDAGRRGALPRGRRLRRRLDRAPAARARRAGAVLAAADARHRAGRARHDPLPRLRQLGLRVLAAAPGRRGRRWAAGAAPTATASGAWRPSRAPRSRRCWTGCCASASASTHRSRTAGRA